MALTEAVSLLLTITAENFHYCWHVWFCERKHEEILIFCVLVIIKKQLFLFGLIYLFSYIIFMSIFCVCGIKKIIYFSLIQIAFDGRWRFGG
jgi:hypothetical protein